MFVRVDVSLFFKTLFQVNSYTSTLIQSNCRSQRKVFRIASIRQVQVCLFKSIRGGVRCTFHSSPMLLQNQTKQNQKTPTTQAGRTVTLTVRATRDISLPALFCSSGVGFVNFATRIGMVEKGKGGGGVNKGRIETEKKNEQGRTTLLSPSEKRM